MTYCPNEQFNRQIKQPNSKSVCSLKCGWKLPCISMRTRCWIPCSWREHQRTGTRLRNQKLCQSEELEQKMEEKDIRGEKGGVFTGQGTHRKRRKQTRYWLHSCNESLRLSLHIQMLALASFPAEMLATGEMICAYLIGRARCFWDYSIRLQT